MITEPSIVGDIEIKDDLSLLSRDKNVMTGSLHLTNNNKTITNCMNTLTINSKEKLDFIRRKSHGKSLYTSKGLKLLFILGLFLFSISIFGQTTGDYRSVSSGNWNSSASWQRFDGASWGTNSYPGSGVVMANDVTIRNGHTINLNIDVATAFTSLIIGDETGATDVLTIPSDVSINTQLITIKSDGFIQWLPNTNHTLSLPNNAQIIIRTGG